MKNFVGNLIRALRLPFILVSIMPFIFGSFIQDNDFKFIAFLFGLLCVIFTHLSANLINDYADSKSGVDWQDKKFFGFFGGSKLIQENVLSENFYLLTAIIMALCSFISIIILSLIIKNFYVIDFYFIIIFLSWAYSQPPFKFSYHRIGEFIIFLLFGPALVMGGYFIQTGIFPDIKSFILSLPFGFITAAILFANEVPDYATDKKLKKMTLASLFNVSKAFIIYYILMGCGVLSILLAIGLAYLNKIALVSIVLIIPIIKSADIIRKYTDNKLMLVKSSKQTIELHLIISIILILGVLL